MKDFITNQKNAPNDAEAAKISNVTDAQVGMAFANMVQKISSNPLPYLFSDAVKNQDWVNAMNQELEALEKNDTWEIVTLPARKRAIGYRWLYKLKYKPDGSLERHKARLVIQGCRQIMGYDYNETFAPVAKMTTVRALLAIAAMEGCHQCLPSWGTPRRSIYASAFRVYCCW